MKRSVKVLAGFSVVNGHGPMTSQNADLNGCSIFPITQMHLMYVLIILFFHIIGIVVVGSLKMEIAIVTGANKVCCCLKFDHS